MTSMTLWRALSAIGVAVALLGVRADSPTPFTTSSAH